MIDAAPLNLVDSDETSAVLLHPILHADVERQMFSQWRRNCGRQHVSPVVETGRAGIVALHSRFRFNRSVAPKPLPELSERIPVDCILQGIRRIPAPARCIAQPCRRRSNPARAPGILRAREPPDSQPFCRQRRRASIRRSDAPENCRCRALDRRPQPDQDRPVDRRHRPRSPDRDKNPGEPRYARR